MFQFKQKKQDIVDQLAELGHDEYDADARQTVVQLQHTLQGILDDANRMYNMRNLIRSIVILEEDLEVDATCCESMNTLCIASRTTKCIYQIRVSPNGVRFIGSMNMVPISRGRTVHFIH